MMLPVSSSRLIRHGEEGFAPVFGTFAGDSEEQ
jgi:hypothetical protein